MGNARSRKVGCSPIRKCAKLDNASDTNDNKKVEEENQCSTPAVPISYQQKWDMLPYVALLQVYKHLPNNDKASMSRTCKQWLVPFSRPSLWRRGNFRFDGIEDWKAMRFAYLMGSALRHIIIECSASAEEKALLGAKSSSVNFSMFLNTLLISHNKKLETVCIQNMWRIVRGASCDGEEGNLLHLVVALIEKQQGIHNLDLTNAGFLSHQAIYILESVKQRCGVHVLAIADIVAQIHRFELATDERFIQLLTSFSNLTDLSLSEEYVTIDLLTTLSNTVASSLERMEVKALYNMRRRPVNNDGLKESWRYLCDRIPNLDLSFIVKGVFVNRNIIKILPAALNLSRLVLDTGNGLMDFRLFYLHMAKFKYSLYDVELAIYIGTEDDARYIIKLVEKLKILRRFNIDSPLIPLPVQITLERNMRHFLSSNWSEQRESVDITINGRKLDLKESWYSYFVGWLTHIT